MTVYNLHPIHDVSLKRRLL